MAGIEVDDCMPTPNSVLNTRKENISPLTEAMNGFAFSVFKQLAKEEKNIVLSPFSISTALSMTLCGALEETAKEIREVLQFENSGISNAMVNSYFEILLTEYSEKTEGCTLAFGNALLLQKDLSTLLVFKNIMKNIFRSLVREVDFMNESGKIVKEVNSWVQENTRDMIKSLFDSLDQSTVMLILNAIYFKGSWKHCFDCSNTRQEVFYNEGDELRQREVPMMYLQKRLRFTEKDTYKALELPYQNEGLVMLILLPNELDGLQNLEDEINIDFLKDTIASLYSFEVEVTLPKFHLEFQKELKKVLMDLGMNSAFQSNANFRGMVESSQVKVSEVVHKAVLDVNEEGSEAAAVTAVVMMLCSLPIYMQFRADHPFLFMIYDKQKQLILFMGRVLEF